MSKIPWKKILLVIGSIVICFITVAGVAVYAFINQIKAPDSIPQQINNIPVTASADKIHNRINILLLGVDDGDPDIPGGSRRSDTMILASINPEDKTINLLSIPRDSRVRIPGRTGYDKITHAFFYGGPALAVRTVEENFRIPVNYYVVLDWKAFIKVVDIVGGVDIAVEREMNYEDPYENLSIHLHKGQQHLDGKKAGEYVRFRHDELGDIGRIQRQEYFLEALTNQMFQAGTILKLPALITTISQHVQTDMSASMMLKVANVLKDMNSNSLHTKMVPGDFATINEISYWVTDAAQTQKIVESMFAAGKN